MFHPAADSILETVKKLNEMNRRARSGEPTADDYLKALASDPVTEWFTVLLRERTAQLENEAARADRLKEACRRWFESVQTRLAEGGGSTEENRLAAALRELGAIPE